ncbi:general transcription factor II-I repeat domain-containing protein 2-like, partial [Aphis craccivora]
MATLLLSRISSVNNPGPVLRSYATDYNLLVFLYFLLLLCVIIKTVCMGSIGNIISLNLKKNKEFCVGKNSYLKSTKDPTSVVPEYLYKSGTQLGCSLDIIRMLTLPGDLMSIADINFYLIYFDKKKNKNKRVIGTHKTVQTVVARGLDVTIVSDMGSSKFGLWRTLNISINNVSFKHQITNFNKGFVLSNGKYIGKKFSANYHNDTR